MSTTTTTHSGGIGILGLLGVVFVTLKLLGITEAATWSWWWVLAPFWGGLALVLVFSAVVLLVAVCIAAWDR